MKHLIRASALAAACCFALTGCGGEKPTADAPVPAPAAATVTPVPAAALKAQPAPRHVGRPARLLIGKINVNEALYGVGIKPDGAMETPDFGDAGWYDLGPRPGARGPAVIVAHVHGPDGDDVFADLHRLAAGDIVTVRRTDGVSTFVVDAVEQSKKEALPTKRIWKKSDQALLRLITCGGIPDPVTRMYPENTVVYAHLVN